jgi:hypothetical protein
VTAVISYEDVERLWAGLDADAQAAKFSHQAILRFEKFYRELSEVDRPVVDEVLAGWVARALDSRRRFDALAIISRFRIRSALPALQQALVALDSAEGPAVPFERLKVERIIQRIETAGSE